MPPADADLLIAQKAMSATATNTVLIGDDTDLLILLIYHTKSDDFFFKTSRNIKAVKQLLGHSVCTHILFIHAITACDTTFHLYCIGKGAPLKKFTTSADFCQHATVFDTQSASITDVVSRHKRICERVATSTSHVQPQSLPRTSAAAKYQSSCVLPGAAVEGNRRWAPATRTGMERE